MHSKHFRVGRKCLLCFFVLFSITAESRFKEDLEADSLDLFELVMALEEEYGVEIPSEDLEKILTVQDVIDYMKNKGVEA